MTPYHAGPRRPLPGSPFNAPVATLPPPEVYVVDDMVTHDKYGLGTVTAVEECAVQVNFGSHERRLSTPCSKLTKL
ncbi:MAG TPA: hypothetical protein VFV41_00125 [Streptosporangiaceae bacterium]|nr:hypothetical protein [Streptosporangiaceae bacterium]